MWNDRKQRQQGTVMMGEANTIHIHLICHSMLLTMLIETAVHWLSGYGTLSVVQTFNIDFIGINGWPEWWLFLGSVADWMETKLLNVVVQALGETEQDLSSWVGKVFSLKNISAQKSDWAACLYPYSMPGLRRRWRGSWSRQRKGEEAVGKMFIYFI